MRPRSTGAHSLQACNSYPESGVCDAATWKVLLGANAQPSDISKLHSGGSDDEDLADQVSWVSGGGGPRGAEGPGICICLFCSVAAATAAAYQWSAFLHSCIPA